MTDGKAAKVAKVINQLKIILNVGSDDDVNLSDDFLIYRVGESILDPDTGENLGDYEEIIGRGTVTHVQNRMCTLESSETKDNGRKVIRKFGGPNGFSALALAFSAREEVIEEPEREAKPFSHALVGDHARKI
jgi:hypothetical protein